MIFNKLNNTLVNELPYKHAVHSTPFLPEDMSLEILEWFETTAPWKLIIADFYQQYEFDVLANKLPNNIKNIFSKDNINNLIKSYSDLFNVNLCDKIDITAHKLIENQIIKIHNDYIPGYETHRLLIQFNRGWSQDNGGILMVFSKENDSFSLSKAINPTHNSAFSFAITPKSYHAVSEINYGERYTLVFSFYEIKNDN